MLHSSSLRLNTIPDEVFTVAITQDSKYIISGSGDKCINVFDIQAKQQMYHIVDAHEGREEYWNSVFSCNFYREDKSSDSVKRQQVHILSWNGQID